MQKFRMRFIFKLVSVIKILLVNCYISKILSHFLAFSSIMELLLHKKIIQNDF